LHRNPMDIFEEVEGMFTRLFAQMEREFSVSQQMHGYCFIVSDDGENLVTQDTPVDEAPVPGLSREPIVEMHLIGNEVKIITGLPGITEETLRLEVKGNVLVIDAGNADHHYHTSAALPPVDMSSMQKTLKNSVLEVTFTSLSEPPEKA
jgi:HSP20 family molecular chaperone IbpA